MKKHLFQPFARAGFIAVLLLSCVLGARAEEGVILSLKNGTEVAFAFSTKPRLAMGAELTITVPDGTNVVYVYADVKNVRFGEFVTTDIDSAPGTENTPDVTFRISDGLLQAFGLPHGESVSVYDLGGRRVAMQKQATEGGTLSIPLPVSGVLVVRTTTGISYRMVNP
ncbi:MAG: secretion protein [Bacteroidaceae bacterium]|nr:secretion protein [Bacteroidaceae bacterium]